MEPILEIAALKKYYGKEPNLTRALDGISFQVMPGEFLGIMGSSGSGKSTLLNCIATVIAPTGGAVALHGKCITTLHGKALADYRGKEIGYLFQNFELIDNLTGRENILLPLALHSVSETESRERLTKLADYLEVADVLDKFPAQMSGGQKQRIAAARALILDPEIVLADEPTGALDSKNARSLMEELSGLNADAGTTILMVTHDCNAASYCKRILFIQDGVLFHELRRDVPDETQQAFYGASWPSWHSWEGAVPMFSELVARNSRRSRRENGLFFTSLLISIVAFYIILSLSHQDVMVFLQRMESDAVNRLLSLVPVLYALTLFILFFLVYYANRFQLARRRHEFGVYLMLGMPAAASSSACCWQRICTRVSSRWPSACRRRC